jgi:hypothetical protein
MNIEDIVKNWYETGSLLPLHEFIGMSWDEYSQYITKNIIPERLKDEPSKYPMTEESDATRVSRTYRAMKMICLQLPLNLKNGAVVDELRGRCSNCNEDIPDPQFRGDINPSIHGYRITAFGLCRPCNINTPHFYEIRAEGDRGYLLDQQPWRGWAKGDVVKVDFQAKKKVD